MTARRAAVLGHPVAHSLSPVLHRAAYAALGLEGWSYDAVDVTSEQLEGFVDALDAQWAGLSLTMPLKQTILPMLDHVEPLAELVGAVNTVLVQRGARGSLVLTGANTDVHGIVAALREGAGERGADDGALPARPRAVVLGSGATAASTLAALGELGCPRAVVYARSLARVGPLMRAAHKMGLEPEFRVFDDRTAAVCAQADLVVSTVPAHGADHVAEALAGQAAVGHLLDVIYEPRPTALMTAWRAAGGVAVGGERMLLHQAAEQVRLMTGRVAPLAAMDAALSGALDPHHMGETTL
ncbi:MAG: shikimate dehydrogenase [Actinomycetales bacterium]|nr:shikimate dehydrogenase [Actinomycetales bacterium]